MWEYLGLPICISAAARASQAAATEYVSADTMVMIYADAIALTMLIVYADVDVSSTAAAIGHYLTVTRCCAPDLDGVHVLYR